MESSSLTSIDAGSDPASKASSGETEHRDRLVTVIGIFKLVKALLLFSAGFGLLSILNKDVAGILAHRIDQLGVDPNNQYFSYIVQKLGWASPKQLALISGGTLVYASLFLTEGIGLLFHKRWAEYLTIVITGSFIPWEVYELIHHFKIFKVLLLVINAAIVVYLFYKVRTRT